MLDEDGGGMLNDWDHVMKLDLEGGSAHTRAVSNHCICGSSDAHCSSQGTWQFMSVVLSSKPDKPHDIMDDLESSFWVLVYQALHLLKSNAKSYHFDVFEDDEDSLVDGECVGGMQKYGFLRSMRGLVFESKPLNDLLAALRPHLNLQIASYDLPDIRERLPKDLGAHVLQIFDTALARSDWPTSDLRGVNTPSANAPVDRSNPTGPPSPHQPPSPESVFSRLPSIDGSSGSTSVGTTSSSRKKRRQPDDGHDVVEEAKDARPRTKRGGSKRARTAPTPPATKARGVARRSTRSLNSGNTSGRRMVTRSQAKDDGRRMTRSRSAALLKAKAK